jgi:hypothetical protein
MRDDFEEGMDDAHTELTDREQELFAALPRLMPGDADQEERVVDALKAEGYFRRGRSNGRLVLQIAAGLVLFIIGGLVGVRYGERNSLEARLAHNDLPLRERVLLLQRAGSAYVTAANAYADATTQLDPNAVEIAQQILLSAAQAVARRNLDGGLTNRLQAAMQSPGASH